MTGLNALLAAYRATDYRAWDAVGSATAAIDQCSPSFDALLRRHGSEAGYFLTAWNPASQQQTLHQNQSATARLLATLTARGIQFIEASGDPRSPDWPPEPGVILLNCPRATAIQLAETFGQNAIVALSVGEPATLVTTSILSDQTRPD